MYQIDNSTYPTSIDCSPAPAANSICFKSSSNNTYVAFQSSNTSNPQTFCLVAINNSTKYRITDNSKPEVGTCNGAMTDGLVAYYPFNGDAKDYSGNGNDGTVNGATLTNGVIGQAYSFDGVDDYIDLSNINTTTLSNCSISFWRKSLNSTQWLLLKGQTTSHYLMAVSTVNFYHSGVGSGVTVYEDGAVVLKDNRNNNWHHYVATGVNLTSWAAISLSNYTGYQYNGSIDDVRVYDRVLSQGEINTLYGLRQN